MKIKKQKDIIRDKTMHTYIFLSEISLIEDKRSFTVDIKEKQNTINKQINFGFDENTTNRIE